MTLECQICKNTVDNSVHEAREMMFGTREVFDYLECAGCGSVHILEVPDLGRFYPADYYAFEKTGEPEIGHGLKRRMAVRSIGNYLVNGRGLLGRKLAEDKPWLTREFPEWLREDSLHVNLDSRILDFGCGGGQLLRALHYFGFRSLTGADTFIDADIAYPTGVKILKRRFEDLSPHFDLVMLHHSFEHLPDPEESLRQIHRLLADGGTTLIRIPVVNYAWEKYGVNWVQLDPPRHLFLYTERAFRMLAERSGFNVVKVVYDSEAFQFHGSEQYLMDIPMNDQRSFSGANESSIFTQEQYDEWTQMARELNAAGRGDQACFYMVKKETTG